MLKKMSMHLGLLMFLFPVLAHGFDCNKPEFGARLEDLNKDGYFVKYKEKAGISYYNYTGPCRMDVHEAANPAISYAFIDNQLYAQIINIPERKESVEFIRKKIEKNVSKQVGTMPFEVKKAGDWWIYQWYNKADNLKYKAKLNAVTKAGKGAYYYEPLRAKLPDLKEAEDPTSLKH